MYEVQEQATLIYGDRQQSSGCLQREGWPEGARGLSGVRNMLCLLTEEVVTWVCTFVKSYQTVHVRAVHFTVINYTSVNKENTYEWKIYIVSMGLNAKGKIKKEMGIGRLGFYLGCPWKEERDGGRGGKERRMQEGEMGEEMSEEMNGWVSKSHVLSRKGGTFNDVDPPGAPPT